MSETSAFAGHLGRCFVTGSEMDDIADGDGG